MSTYDYFVHILSLFVKNVSCRCQTKIRMEDPDLRSTIQFFSVMCIVKAITRRGDCFQFHQLILILFQPIRLIDNNSKINKDVYNYINVLVNFMLHWNAFFCTSCGEELGTVKIHNPHFIPDYAFFPVTCANLEGG